MSDYIIRKATIRDAENIFVLWKKLALDHMKKQKGETVLDLKTENPYYGLLDENKDVIILVAENDHIFAFLEVYLKNKDEEFSDDRYAYILHCFVEEKFRNSRAIFDLLANLSVIIKQKNINNILADVFVHNKIFYKSIKILGFTEYKTRFIKKIDDC